MTKPRSDVRPIADPEGSLEQAFIDEYVRMKGLMPGDVKRLPDERRRVLLKEASSYAAAKLAQVEARARYVHQIHGAHGEE